MNQLKMSWKGFRDECPTLSEAADCFEAEGFELIYYKKRVVDKQRRAIMQVSNGLDDYVIYGDDNNELELSRIAPGGKTVLVPLPPQKFHKSIWERISAAIGGDALMAR